MTEFRNQSFSAMPWDRKLLIVLFSPFALVVSAIVLPVFTLFCGLAVAYNYVLERRFQSKMRHCGRFLQWKDALKRISGEGGTLIIENLSLGWNITHAWWTPENPLKDSPFSEPDKEDYKHAAERMSCRNWDRWCWDNFTCPENGRALLLRVWNGASLQRRLKKCAPELQVVRTWTALVHYPELSDDQNNDEQQLLNP